MDAYNDDAMLQSVPGIFIKEEVIENDENNVQAGEYLLTSNTSQLDFLRAISMIDMLFKEHQQRCRTRNRKMFKIIT